ncbi:MAG TPA: TetR/AcrR family transcriptional regulator [Spirochaetota bacterium]|nr:TetR/AcrR family transcriptional regulator [Spirochaetota bacterium]HSA15237.1 TetR/AcrR family transcriptional regulator [Spirochaetota bacterium]
MKKLNSTHKKTPAKIEVIIMAALECFNELGFNGTGMNDICARGGTSVGSVYHHFKSKDQLAARVYIEGIKNYQSGYIEELLKHNRPRDGIFAIVRYHINWVYSNRDWARFLFRMRHEDFMWAVEEEFAQLNKKFFDTVGTWFRKGIQAGEIRKMSPDMYPPVLMGPCQEFTRMLLEGKTFAKQETAASELAESAWRAVKAV